MIKHHHKSIHILQLFLYLKLYPCWIYKLNPNTRHKHVKSHSRPRSYPPKSSNRKTSTTKTQANWFISNHGDNARLTSNGAMVSLISWFKFQHFLCGQIYFSVKSAHPSNLFLCQICPHFKFVLCQICPQASVQASLIKSSWYAGLHQSGVEVEGWEWTGTEKGTGILTHAHDSQIL